MESRPAANPRSVDLCLSPPVHPWLFMRSFLHPADLTFYGSSSARNLVLILGRDDRRKDKYILQQLTEQLSHQNCLIITCELSGLERHAPFSLKPSGFLLWCRALWSRRFQSIWFRCAHARQVVAKHGKDKKHFIIGRSSGARVASLIADSLNAAGLICIGYPFHHPEHGVEPQRFLHLKNLRTPTLIIQGTQDMYGGRNILTDYKFSPGIDHFFIDTNHDLEMPQSDLEKMIARVLSYIRDRCGDAMPAKVFSEELRRRA